MTKFNKQWQDLITYVQSTTLLDRTGGEEFNLKFFNATLTGVSQKSGQAVTDIFVSRGLTTHLIADADFHTVLDPVTSKDKLDTGLMAHVYGVPVWTTSFFLAGDPVVAKLNRLPSLILRTADGQYHFFDVTLPVIGQGTTKVVDPAPVGPTDKLAKLLAGRDDPIWVHVLPADTNVHQWVADQKDVQHVVVSSDGWRHFIGTRAPEDVIFRQETANDQLAQGLIGSINHTVLHTLAFAAASPVKTKAQLIQMSCLDMNGQWRFYNVGAV